MVVYKCKMCGGDLQMDSPVSVAICQCCGSTMTLPTAVDEKIANLFNRADQYRRGNEFDRALAVYEEILNENNASAEAHWGLVLCKYGIEYVRDPKDQAMVPTCHRAQKTSILLDVDYKQAVEFADSAARSVYENEARRIDAIHRQILAISAKEEPYDIFLCYKETSETGSRTKDSVLAQEIYFSLKDQGHRVFFSRITLEDKLGSAYEPYIFAALNSAKVMVVVATKGEYVNSVWTKNEWSRYLALINKGERKVLIPAYRDMDPYDLPAEFSHLQALDMAKLGFIQDLVRGIKKIVDHAEGQPKANAAGIQGAAMPAQSSEALLKRAHIFLEDGNFNSADEYFEKVLDQNPEEARAYWGKLMVERQVRYDEKLADETNPLENSGNFKRAVNYAGPELSNKYLACNRTILERNKAEAKKRQQEQEEQERKRLEEQKEKEEKRKQELYQSLANNKTKGQILAGLACVNQLIKLGETGLEGEQSRLTMQVKERGRKRRKMFGLMTIIVLLVALAIKLLIPVVSLALKRRADMKIAQGIIEEMVPIPGQNYTIGKYEVTQGQWKAIMGSNPSHFRFEESGTFPVENVSWNHCQAFIRKLNEMSKKKFRLPTVAEWEYASQASAVDLYGDLYSIAWFEENSGKTVHPVGQKQPNAFGLYDTIGNVWEWCHDTTYNSMRAIRGGGWNIPGRYLRTTSRSPDFDYRGSHLGFRLAMDMDVTESKPSHAGATDSKEIAPSIDLNDSESERPEQNLVGDENIMKSALPIVDGWQMSDPVFTKNTLGEKEIAEIKATYIDADTRHLDFRLVDAGSASELLAPLKTAFSLNVFSDDEGVFQKISTHNNVPVIEKFEKQNWKASLEFILRDHFIIRLEIFDEKGLELLWEFLNKIDLDHIE